MMTEGENRMTSDSVCLIFSLGIAIVLLVVGGISSNHVLGYDWTSFGVWAGAAAVCLTVGRCASAICREISRAASP